MFKALYPFGTGKRNCGYIPDPNTEGCADSTKDETLCETCAYYEESHGIPMCCGNEYKEKDE